MEKSFNKTIKCLMKDKSLSANQKYEKICMEYAKYFLNVFPNEVNFATFELHYEEFMVYNRELKRDVKQEYEYSLCFDEEFENRLYVDCAKIYLLTQILKYKGLNPQNLNGFADDFYQNYQNLQSKVNFGKDFPYEKFYVNLPFRSQISRNLKRFYNYVLEDYAELQKSEKSL